MGKDISNINFIKGQLTESADIKQKLASEFSAEILNATNILIESLKNGGSVYFCGNGGSAADSQHLAAELVAKLNIRRRALPALALTTDTSFITAFSNDDDFSGIFERQLEAFGKPNDVLVGISTSGNSKNIIKAVKYSNRNKIKSIILTGGSGGILKELADFSIIVPSNSTQRIQEAHICIGHIFCDLIEQSLFPIKK